MSIWLICYLLFLHWMADFVLQSDFIAQNKSKSNTILFYHCLVYAGIFTLFTLNPLYGGLLGLIHFPVDYITSRLNSKMFSKWFAYIKEETHDPYQKPPTLHNFFVSIGFDQFIHVITIFYVWDFLRGATHVQ